jgi:hypothetical protein
VRREKREERREKKEEGRREKKSCLKGTRTALPVSAHGNKGK